MLFFAGQTFSSVEKFNRSNTKTLEAMKVSMFPKNSNRIFCNETKKSFFSPGLLFLKIFQQLFFHKTHNPRPLKDSIGQLLTAFGLTIGHVTHSFSRMTAIHHIIFIHLFIIFKSLTLFLE